MNDNEYMSFAVELAKKGCGWVNPNPMVGAVIVKNGEIIGRGWHEKFGHAHAERNALATCRENPGGSTLYVTLEPCCHLGKQPPCVNAILEAGISRVIIGSKDPNPLVAGKGIQLLRDNGVEVVENVLSEECSRLNEVFFHFIRTKRPYVVLKYAMTMDGKIAAYTGASKWITGETARNHVQQLRHRYSGIMVGIGTVITDDPMLNCRIPGGRNPVRIICDTHLKTPIDAKIVVTAKEIPTILATCCSDRQKQEAYLKAGCRIICLNEKEGHVDIVQLMGKLGQYNIDSVMIEGGGTLNWAALQSRIVSKVYTYISPKIFGGQTAKTPVGGQGVTEPDFAFRLKTCEIKSLEEDFLIESEVVDNVYGNS